MDQGKREDDHQRAQRRFFSVDVRMHNSLEQDGQESGYIVKVEATIRCDEYERDSDNEPVQREAGRAIAYRIFSGRALNEGASLFEECDAYHQTTLDYYRVLFDDSGEFLPEIQRMFPDTYDRDVLILDLVEVVPQFRGQRVGLLVAKRLIDMFEPSNGLVVCKPFPLQYNAEHRDHPAEKLHDSLRVFTCDEDTALRKLRNYWQQIGFRRIGRSPYYALAMNNVMPSFRELIRDTEDSQLIADHHDLRTS